jgi:hypothetical protein
MTMVLDLRYNPVIASEAKQSRAAHAEGLDCFVASLLAMTTVLLFVSRTRCGILRRCEASPVMPLRRAGTVTNTEPRYGPGSAAHRCALRCVRGTREVGDGVF